MMMMMMTMMMMMILAVEFSPLSSFLHPSNVKTLKQSLIMFLPLDMRQNSAPAHNGNIIIIYYNNTFAIYTTFLTH